MDALAEQAQSASGLRLLATSALAAVHRPAEMLLPAYGTAYGLLICAAFAEKAAEAVAGMAAVSPVISARAGRHCFGPWLRVCVLAGRAALCQQSPRAPPPNPPPPAASRREEREPAAGRAQGGLRRWQRAGSSLCRQTKRLLTSTLGSPCAPLPQALTQMTQDGSELVLIVFL